SAPLSTRSAAPQAKATPGPSTCTATPSWLATRTPRWRAVDRPGHELRSARRWLRSAAMAGGTQPTPGVRRRRRDEAGCHAVLRPALVEAARRAGATTVGLVDVGRPAGLNLAVDRVGISYSNGQVVGD